MTDDALTGALISQYQAAFAMFRSAIAAMPPARWDNPTDRNRTWRIAWHALFFTHLYLSSSEAAFIPWERAPAGFDPHEDPFEAPGETPVYTVNEILEYAEAIESMLASHVATTPYDGPSGFSWIRVARFEHHIRNIRHLQHHTGQLFERARAAGGEGLEWTGIGPSARTLSDTASA
jgi:hypothetical protein